ARDAIKNEEEEEKQEATASRKDAIQPKVPILVRDRETLRSTMPMLSLFGCSYGNRMLSGLVKVGWAIPALQQTEHITNVESTVSLSDDRTRFQLKTRHDLWHEDENKKCKQSLYYIEVVGAGIPFFHEYSIGLSTTIERLAMLIAIDTFKNNPYVGVKSSTSH